MRRFLRTDKLSVLSVSVIVLAQCAGCASPDRDDLMTFVEDLMRNALAAFLL